MKRVLFIGTNNSGRSQMAEAIVNHHYNGRVVANSAGVNPEPLNEYAIAALNEIGLDISKKNSNKPEDFQDDSFDYIITLCDQSREECPAFWTQGEAIYQHLDIYNPAKMGNTPEEKLKAFRETRDEIEFKMNSFFDRELGWEEKIIHKTTHPILSYILI
jgi:arsenate reductase